MAVRDMAVRDIAYHRERLAPSAERP